VILTPAARQIPSCAGLVFGGGLDDPLLLLDVDADVVEVVDVWPAVTVRVTVLIGGVAFVDELG